MPNIPYYSLLDSLSSGVFRMIESFERDERGWGGHSDFLLNLFSR